MRIALLILCLGLPLLASTQSVLDKRVTVSYEEEPLIRALADLDQRYQLTFSYSSDLIQVDYPVNAYFEQAPLREVLDVILGDAGIDYTEMNGLILLRNKPQVEPPVLSQQRLPVPEEKEPEPEIFEGTPPWKEEVLVTGLEVPKARYVSQLPRERNLPQPGWAIFDSLQFYGHNGTAVLQYSIFPYLGNYMEDSDRVTSNISVNLIWGVSGGVNGLEMGLLVNHTRGHMRGFQAGGLVNLVSESVTGFQLSGGANVSEDRSNGLQVAGVGNFSRIHQGLQLTTGINVVSWRAGGLQIAGLMNVAGGKSSAVTQFAGITNINRGGAGFQLSSFLNVAREVYTGQVGLLNVGGDVEGFQLGIINIADTIAGPSIGLINIIKKGYNRFDLSYSDVFWIQSGWALGSPRFYNLIQVGYRGSDGRANASWGLGYGIGTRMFTKKKWMSNVEVFVYHVNEEQFWTKEMNWLGQFRWLFEKHTGFLNRLYFGPVLQFSASRLNPTESGFDGTKLAPYSMIESINPATSYKAWVGINAGLRF